MKHPKIFYENYLPISRDVFMCLAVVYLLGFIGVALLCIWYSIQLFLHASAILNQDLKRQY